KKLNDGDEFKVNDDGGEAADGRANDSKNHHENEINNSKIGINMRNTSQ
ncbi:32915_t:CDS:1, partial [Racocetra persica]